MDRKEGVPAFVDKNNRKYDAILEKLDDLLDEIQVIEERLDDLTNVRRLRRELARTRDQCARNTAEIAIIKDEVKNNEDRLATCEARCMDTDSRAKVSLQRSIFDARQVKFSGVPVGLDNREAALKILEVIGLANMSSYIFEIRDWLAKANPQSDTSAESQANDTKTFVVEFISNEIRDKIVRRSFKLRYKTCRKIFGCGGEGKISINAIWPKQVYELYRLADSFSKKLNYAKPVINNFIVCMRETRESPLIVIDFPEDLVVLQPRREC